MDEINAWGAYESATTQNARSLGRNTRRSSSIRKRRPAVHPSSNESAHDIISEADESISIANLIEHKAKSSHALFFGTDDVSNLKKTDKTKEAKDIEAATKALESKKYDDPEKEKEFIEIRDLAHDVFEVYFTTDDSTADIGKLKEQKRKLHAKINGTMPWLPVYLRKSTNHKFVVETLLFVEASLRGIAQVYFQNNPISGLLILAAMFVQSSRVAVHGTIALIAGNLAGIFMGFDKSFLSCGLFGYNSFLVGLAISTFYSPEKHAGYSWQIVVGAIIFAYFSSVLFVMLGKVLAPYKTPPFTLPFNIATLMFLLAMGQMNNVDMASVRPPALPDYDTVTDIGTLTARAFFAGSIRGVGQVFLANNIVSGVLVLVAIAVCSRISALAAFIGSAVGAGTAALVGSPADAIENGMFGFNSSLTLTAMLMFYVPSIGSSCVGVIASIITVFVQLALATSLEPCGLPFMTLPFCFAALAYIVIQGTTSNVISVPLSSMTTPEDHLNRVSKLSDGFDLLYGAIHSSSYEGPKRKSLGSIVGYNGGTKRLTSVLEEYEEEINGGTERSLFQKLCWCFGNKKEETSAIMREPSFRMSFAMKNPTFGNKEKDDYARMFNYIDNESKYEVRKSQFEKFLRSVGLDDQVGIDFACQSFQLMDLDGSGEVDLDEFIAFAKISRHMPVIRRLVVKFFDFVDVNGDKSVEMNELDSARSYLGLPALSEEDHESLQVFCNEDGELEFDVIVNFVTIFKLKSIVKSYQTKLQDGASLDQSMHSALSGS